MITEYLLIAGFVIAVKFKLIPAEYQTDNFFYKLFLDYFRGFIVKNPHKKIDYIIVFEPRSKVKVILNQKEQSTFILFYKRIGKNALKTSYDIGIIQCSLLLREVMQELLFRNDGFILHGSSVGYKNEAFVFSGKSGAGKSTLVKILQQEFQPLADDMVILRRIKKVWYVFQTPFFEKNYLFFRNYEPYKLKAILVPKKSDNNFISNFKNQNKQFKLLISQFFSSTQALPSQIMLIQELIKSQQVLFGEINFGLKNKKKVVELIRNYEG